MVEKSDLAAPDWFSQFYGPFRRMGERVAEFFSPVSEASRSDDAYDVTLELPGVAENDIAVEVNDGRLTISGEKRTSTQEEGKDYFFSERTFGRFQRIFRLPPDADEDSAAAAYKDGVLTIKFAKLKPEKTAAKSVPINR